MEGLAHDEKERVKFEAWLSTPIPGRAGGRVSQSVVDEEMALFQQARTQMEAGDGG